MTPLESEFLQGLGLTYLLYLAPLSILVLFYGVFVMLFAGSVVVFMRRGFSNRTTATMFVATIINFLLSTLNVGSQIATVIVFIRKTLMITLDIDYPLSEKPELINNALRKAYLVNLWASTFPIFLSDLIVIWRAWTLFQDRQWVILVPFILWIAALGIAIGGQIWISIPNDYDQLNSKVDGSLTTASIALSMATNAVTTMMVAYKVWSYRTLLVKTLGLSRRKSPVQTVLILLVESGLVYLAFQIVYLVLSAVYTGSELDVYSFYAVYLSFAPMYPTVVILLVETQRSIKDICEISPSNASKLACPGPLGHLSFAVRPVRSTMNNEAESQRSHTLRPQGGQEHSFQEVVLEVKVPG